MNELILETFQKARQLAREGRYEEAQDVLIDFYGSEEAAAYREELLGPILLQCGNLAIDQEDYAEAFEALNACLEYGYQDFRVPLHLSMLLEMSEAYSDEQKLLEEAVSAGYTGIPQRMLTASLFNFYLRRELFLKAEKLAAQVLADHPEDYFGRHMKAAILIKKKKYDEAKAFLDSMSEEFGEDPVYLQDRLDYYHTQKDYAGEIREMSRNPAYDNQIRHLVLQRKLDCYFRLREEEDFRAAARELFVDYDDERGSFAELLLAISDQNFITAARVADYILTTRRDDRDFLFYLTLFIQPFILTGFSAENMKDANRETAARAGRLAIEWFAEHGFRTEGLKELYKTIDVIL